MDYQEAVNAIGSVGFPIVACGALFWMVNTTMKELTTAIDNLAEAVKGESGVATGKHAAQP